MNKFLLVAINSKYIHSNLAVYCLKAATAYSDKVYIREFTINNQLEDILKNIYLEKPDVIGISCYIWNINYVKELLPELNKVLPGVKILEARKSVIIQKNMPAGMKMLPV